MFTSVLIANRGEIAARVLQTANRLGLRTICVYSDADANAAYLQDADERYLLGPAPATESYLRADKILEIAKQTGAECIHPGYGFLSENADFSEACAAAGIKFVGPSAEAIRAMGLKDAAKALMEKAGVPVVPGYHGDNQDPDFLAGEADRIGYPVLIKAVAGGGGKGMRRVDDPERFKKDLKSAKREAASSFGDDRVLVEKFVAKPRHIEVQVFGDAHGNVHHLFERDCSLQRRHQKVVEEAPAPGMTEEMRAAMCEAAVAAAQAINYEGAGTVEFIVDASDGLHADGFYFMEMNTRLQVEHPVTEAITDLDLVEEQFRVAAGEEFAGLEDDEPMGHAIEVRLYAENPQKNFFPSAGHLHHLHFPDWGADARIDTGVRQGDDVSMFYDPMIAKIIVHGDTRDEAIENLQTALSDTRVAGLNSNVDFLRRVADNAAFAAGDVHTGFIDQHLDDLVPGVDDHPPVEVVLAGAVCLLRQEQEGLRAQNGNASPWDALDGWRVGGRAVRTLSFEVAGHTHVVTARYGAGEGGAGFTMTLGDTTYDVGGVLEPFDDELSLSVDGRRATVHVVRRDDVLTVITPDRHWPLGLVDAHAFDEGGADGAVDITAPMPGKIIAVQVEKGAQVKKGDALVTLEAMKMEHALSAAADAVIGDVLVSVGDQVDEGAALVRFEEAGA